MYELDWTRIRQVEEYASHLSKGGARLSVVRYPGRKNYNIMHTENEDKNSHYLILSRWHNGERVK